MALPNNMVLESEALAPAPQVSAADAQAKPAGTSSPSKWKARIEKCKTKRRRLITDWTINIDYRRGKQFDADSDYDRIAVACDWSMTKSKQSQLFSQVPKIVSTAKQKAYAPAAPIFGKVVNDQLTAAGVGVAMDECLPDAINAAGIAAVIVAYESRQAPKEVPSLDPAKLPPELQSMLAMGTYQIPMETIDAVIDERFTINRISPADLLWPIEFTGSDYDKAPWVGRSGRMTWSEAKAAFGLTDEQKNLVVGDTRTDVDKLTPSMSDDASGQEDDETVSFDEIFYWRYRFLADEKYYKAIQRVVFVKGIDAPVVDEPWAGQRFDENLGGYIGSCRFPIRVLTLTYISDECIPPSDSAMIRPQVDELIKSRGQIMKQRDHSIPVRWFDVNRIDATIQTQLMQGDYQGFIPTNGDGTRAIGEVARSSYPRENFQFDSVIKNDMNEALGMGPNQQGTPMASGEHSATEAGITQENFQTRIGYERAKCVNFFIGIADVMAGLVVLYGDFEMPDISEEDQQKLMLWDRERINHAIAFTVRADSTVLLSAGQRTERLMNIINTFGKSGMINPQSLIDEVLSLADIDPATVMVEPKEPPKDQPKISYNFKGEDLNNPMVVAVLVEGGMAPSIESLEAAKKMMMAVQIPPAAPPPDPNAAPPAPAGPDTTMQDARPDWQMVDRINQRREV